MRDKSSSTLGIESPSRLEIWRDATRREVITRAGLNGRNGFWNYESPKGEQSEGFQAIIRYVTARGPALADVVDNEAMTDILIKKSAIGGLVSGGASTKPEEFVVGEVWLASGLKQDEEGDGFAEAEFACRLRPVATEAVVARSAPRPHDPARIGYAGNGRPASSNGSPLVAERAAKTAPLAVAIDLNRHYEGNVVYNPKGLSFAFVRNTMPSVYRDPHLDRVEVGRLKALGAADYARIGFRLKFKDDFDGKGQLLVAWDARPL